MSSNTGLTESKGGFHSSVFSLIERLKSLPGQLGGRRLQNATDQVSNQSLERELSSYQIFMILISGIIGITVLGSLGQLLRTAGPAGLMTAIAYVGINAIFVMEGIGEMVVLWPVSGAMIEYVRRFVDKDLAIVIGIAYWYSWSSVVAAMLVVAGNLTDYWDPPAFWSTLAFYFLGPVLIIGINAVGIKYFGLIEGVLGTVKFAFVLVGAGFLFGVGSRYGSERIDTGYQFDSTVTVNDAAAVLLIIPYLTYGFLGIESISTTAFEARQPKEVRQSARWIAPVITILFVLCGIGVNLNVQWDTLRLEKLGIASADQHQPLQKRDEGSLTSKSFSVLVLAAEQAELYRWAGILNGFLVVSCLSAANTALYIASRTLYSLCKGFSEDDKMRLKRWVARLGSLDSRTRVPHFALVASAAAFFWLPFLHLREGYSVNSLLEIVVTVGSVGCVLVWASQCVAFIRYDHWLRIHKSELGHLIQTQRQWQLENPGAQPNIDYGRYDRRNRDRQVRYYSILSTWQPLPAYIGLLMCFLTVVVFSSATMWQLGATPRRFFTAYAGLIACTLLWLILKLRRYLRNGKVQWRTDLSEDPHEFRRIINRFERLLYLRQPRPAAGDSTHGINGIVNRTVTPGNTVRGGGGTSASEVAAGGQAGRQGQLPEVIELTQPDRAQPAVIAMGTHHGVEGRPSRPYGHNMYPDRISGSSLET